MHGKNPIRKHEKNSTGESLQVREIFRTMQGEGPFAGQRAIFVRLSGCHLACTFCDTIWDDAHDPYMEAASIVADVRRLWFRDSGIGAPNRPLVVLTGGEPLRQNISLLVELLANELGALVQIETAGSFWWPALRMRHIRVVVSPKTSYVHPDIAAHALAYKYIIRASEQLSPLGLPTGSTQNDFKRVRIAESPPHLLPHAIYVSPCDEGDDKLNKANLDVCLKLVLDRGYALNLQLHKLVNLP